MYGSTARIEPSATPSLIIAAKRSDIRLARSTIIRRIGSGRALSAEERSNGPRSESWNSTSVAAADEILCQ